MNETLREFYRPNAGIPPLRDGDRLDRAEFERRYWNLPNLKRAELIDGIVRLDQWKDERHGSARAALIGLVGWYFGMSRPLRAGAQTSIRLDATNEVQPDVSARLPRRLGGRSIIDSDDFVSGAPDFVGEVVPDRNAYAFHEKLSAFARCGVREYLVWRVQDAEIDWFRRHTGSYVRLAAGEDGVTRSETFPGLWIDLQSLVKLDVKRASDVLQAGMRTPEYREFVGRLASAAE